MPLKEIRLRLAPYLNQPPGAAALRLVKRAFGPWLEWGTLVFLEQDLEMTPEIPGCAAPGIRELTAADLPGLIGFRRSQADLAGRLGRGDRAFAFFEASSRAPLHVRWGTTAPTWIPEVGLWLHPRAREFYLYDVMTDPLHRGRRLGGLVGGAMDKAFGEEGFRTKIGYVRKDNHSMVRSMQWARVPLRRLFEIRYLRWAGGAPRLLDKPAPPLFLKQTCPDAGGPQPCSRSLP